MFGNISFYTDVVFRPSKWMLNINGLSLPWQMTYGLMDYDGKERWEQTAYIPGYLDLDATIRFAFWLKEGR